MLIRLCAFIAASSMLAVAVLVALFALPVIAGSQGTLLFAWVWRPDAGLYGIMPMVCASLVLSLSALLLAWPVALGLACAVNLRGDFGPWLLGLVRFMTTIPTVVYGFASIFLLVPLVREAAGSGSGLCWLSAMLVLALLIVPTMVLLLDAALRNTTQAQGEGLAALGFSRAAALAYVALPACLPYMLGAAVLGFGRAIGDTLIPLMLAGNAPQVPVSLFSAIRTLTAHMAMATAGEAGGAVYNSLYAAGGLLLLVSTGVSLCLRRLAVQSSMRPAAVYWGGGCAPLLVKGWAWCSSLVVCTVLGVLLGFLLLRGVPQLGLSLFFGETQPLLAISGLTPVWDGIWPACVGTLSLLALTMALALAPGIGCGIYLAMFAPPRIKAALGLMVDVMAGVPSIVMGLFGFSLIVFLRRFWPSASPGLFLAALCLALLVLPSLIVASRSALESLPASLRLAGTTLGLSRAQCLRHILLPQASRGVLGGIMLAMGRAAEDTAVIILTGVVVNAGLPAGLGMRFEALPFTIYYTAAQYQNAAELGRGFGAALVLLLLSGSLLLVAWHLQRQYQRLSERGFPQGN